MPVTDVTILQTRLKEAEDAYHLLMTGSQEVSVHIDGYGSVTYTSANMTQLERYITNLKMMLSQQSGRGGRKAIFVEF